MIGKKHDGRIRDLMDGNEAGAWAARRSKAEFMPNFPVTPQTEMIETLASWYAEGTLHSDFMPMDSEHSVLSAAIGAEATGVRTFTATSSQGLELMHEMMYIASGMRLPIVMTNVSRGLSAPITLWSDHNDFLSLRDTGWLMFHAQDNQEVFDSIVMAFKISEDKRVLLPSVVNMDGYVLSYTMEPTVIESQATVDRFLKPYNPTHAYFKPGRPLVQGAAVLYPDDYTYFRQQHHKAQLNSEAVIKNVCHEWKKLTGREYGFTEKFMTEDAEMVLVTQGSISTTAKAEVIEMRKQGIKVGLLRLRVIRPFPRKEIAEALWNADGVAVVDKDLAPGAGGIMYSEVRDCLFDVPEKPIVSSFILGLGGKPETMKQFKHIVDLLDKDMDDEKGRIRFV